MAEQQSEVRPHVSTMPGSTAFVLQTGGSARRRVIKPEGEAPSIVFRVSGVPGHTHNSSAVASVLCDLQRQRGFTHNLTDAWGDAAVAMDEEELGDSVEVDLEDSRFDRAIERAVGEITLIPENCHQEIREPTRSIAEVRTLVAPSDQLQTMTYVEEVGGFVDAQNASSVYMSDYPNISVDLLGQQDLNDASKSDGGAAERWNGKLGTTPVSIRSTDGYLNDDETGEGWNFVVLRDGDNSVGTLDDGTNWYGIVPFKWIQGSKQYQSDPFTVTLRRTVEVGPRPPPVDGVEQPFQNQAESALTVTFPSMHTTPSSNGYCFLAKDYLDAQTILLGATATNGDNYYPEIFVSNVTKPGMQFVSTYAWHGPSAYRFLVGGEYALPGPTRTLSTKGYFATLRNMMPAALAADMRAEFLAFLLVGATEGGTGGTNWEGTNDDDLDAAHPEYKFNNYFSNMNLQGRRSKFPVAGLARNAYSGSTWYPLSDPFPTVAISQQVLAYDGTGVDDTGQEVVRGILAQAGAVTENAWRDSDIVVDLNKTALRRNFEPSGIVPPGIVAQGAAAIDDWFENVDDKNEAQQTLAEAAQQAAIDLAQTAYANAPGPVTLAALEAAEAELTRIITLRIPPFDEWYANSHLYNRRAEFSISSAAGTQGTVLAAFTNASMVNQKMMMVRQDLRFYKGGAVQGFTYDADTGDVTHTKALLYTQSYHLLCDVEEGYGVSATIRASGTIQELFEMGTYIDTNDNNNAKVLHLRSIQLPSDDRLVFAYANAIFQANAWNTVSQEQAALDLAILKEYEGPGFDEGDYVDENGIINVQDVITGLRNLSQALITATYEDFLTMGVGNALEVLMGAAVQAQAPNVRPQLIDYAAAAGSIYATMLFQDLAFGFESERLFFVSINNIGKKTADHKQYHPSVYYFLTSDCVPEAREQTVDGITRMHVCTRVTKLYTWDNTILQHAHLHAQLGSAHGHMKDSICLCQMGSEFQALWFGANGTTSVFDAIKAESRQLGPVFRSQRRISQHLCAPILNPNARLHCSAPLNYETRHLPPELRDFVIRLGDVDWSFLPGKVTMEPLTLYEFNGGNQKPATQDNLLHLPQFRQGSTTELTAAGAFDFEVFSPYGMPSYIAVFARDKDFSVQYKTQPLVKRLSIMCNTTMKKSNTILNADVHQLYHITQRNVHPRSHYTRDDFNDRQVVLLRAEDIGLLGLDPSEYQYEKRAVFRFQGTVDQVGRVTALLIFNNRGLYVHGKQLSVERLVR